MCREYVISVLGGGGREFDALAGGIHQYSGVYQQCIGKISRGDIISALGCV